MWFSNKNIPIYLSFSWNQREISTVFLIPFPQPNHSWFPLMKEHHAQMKRWNPLSSECVYIEI